LVKLNEKTFRDRGSGFVIGLSGTGWSQTGHKTEWNNHQQM